MENRWQFLVGMAVGRPYLFQCQRIGEGPLGGEVGNFGTGSPSPQTRQRSKSSFPISMISGGQQRVQSVNPRSSASLASARFMASSASRNNRSASARLGPCGNRSLRDFRAVSAAPADSIQCLSVERSKLIACELPNDQALPQPADTGHDRSH